MNSIENLICPAIQQYRSNPPEAAELRRLVNDASWDGSKIDELKAFLQGKRFNVDLIDKIGYDLDFQKCSRKKTRALDTLAILRLDDIKLYRTQKRLPLEELLIEARFDLSRFDACRAEYVKNPVNVDDIRMRDDEYVAGG